MSARHIATAAVLVGTILFPACASRATTHSVPEPAGACDDPLYARLRSTEPDSLSEREWARLVQLEQACVAERGASTNTSIGGHGMHDGMGRMWLVMPLMMVVGGVMWLAMSI